MNYNKLMEEEITLEKAQHLLRDTFGSPKQGNISIEIIQKVVADKYGISVSILSTISVSSNNKINLSQCQLPEGLFFSIFTIPFSSAFSLIITLYN